MQINFWMAPEDRNKFHEYVFSRNGYLLPAEWPTRDFPIIRSIKDDLIEQYFMRITTEEIFPSSNYCDHSWTTQLVYREGFYLWGPAFEYRMCLLRNGEICSGRLYVDITHGSFNKPDVPYGDAYTKYESDYKAALNFYRSCCRYIRKSCRRSDSGFYHGIHCDKLEEAGLCRTVNFF